MRTFEIAADRQRGQREPIPFKVKLPVEKKPVEKGKSTTKKTASATEELTLHINPSAQDALAVLSGEYIAAEQSKSSTDIARASSEMLQTLFTPETYVTLKRLLREGRISSDDLGQFTEHAIETVTGRPTESQSA